MSTHFQPHAHSLCGLLAGSDPASFQSWLHSVTTSELTIRLGSWTWSEDAPFPPWESLQRAKFWTSEKAIRFHQSFCRPKLAIKMVQSTDTSQATFSLEKQEEKGHITVTVFSGKEDTVSAGIESLNIRCGVWHVSQTKGMPLEWPEHVLSVIDNGVPVLIWGKKSTVDKATNHVRKLTPVKEFIQLALFLRPSTPPPTSRFKTTEFSACLVTDSGCAQSQVSIPLLYIQCI